ncbi:MAG: Hpt domain-containing protein [Planctomycetales bacterium]|nr:Hpt domain-containing protein [Planctomycetales bacterium]
MSTSASEDSWIYSTFGDDPDLGELVEMFVDEMEQRIASFQNAFEQGDLNTLGTLAHQLKGAAGSYGFNQLTPAAFDLEQSARSRSSAEAIEASLDRLTQLCQRTRAGAPDNA